MNLYCKSRKRIVVCIHLEGNFSSLIVILLIVVINFIVLNLMMLFFLHFLRYVMHDQLHCLFKISGTFNIDQEKNPPIHMLTNPKL
jgi:hypothetical protein